MVCQETICIERSPFDHSLGDLLTLVLLNTIYPNLANSVDPDQLASAEAN